jgi:ubiquinone/menaquinone biosynthesis C-methylase UbiE
MGKRGGIGMFGQPHTNGIDAFTSVASTYETWFTSPLGRFVNHQELEALARVLPGVRQGDCIDIGAGTGHIAAWLAERGHQITAIEPSPAMRREGVRRSAGRPINWCAARAEDLPFADDSFDCAFLFTSLEFVRHPAQALSEAFRVVRPEGQVVVGFLHALSPWVALYRYQADHGAAPWWAATFFTGEEIERWIGQTAESVKAAVYLAPQAMEPFEEADRAGKRAGNQPALEIRRWEKRR